MAKNRNYNYRDNEMCLASKIIAGNFKTNLPELSAIRTNWTPVYADNLMLRIDGVIDNDLGIDSKKELRNASGSVSSVQIPAQRDLSFFKTQVDEDFKSDKSQLQEILKSLGFTKYLREVQKGDQEELISLLYTFKKNMTQNLKSTITEKGLNPALIDKIISYADALKEANVSQETLKETTKEITQEVVDNLNGIYDEVIGICKIASNYYQFEPLKKEQFTFSKVVKNLGAAGKTNTITE